MKWGKRQQYREYLYTNASSRQAGKLSGRPENIQPWTMIDKPWQFKHTPPDRADSFAFHLICIGFNAIGDDIGLFFATQTDTHPSRTMRPWCNHLIFIHFISRETRAGAIMYANVNWDEHQNVSTCIKTCLSPCAPGTVDDTFSNEIYAWMLQKKFTLLRYCA